MKRINNNWSSSSIRSHMWFVFLRSVFVCRGDSGHRSATLIYAKRMDIHEEYCCFFCCLEPIRFWLFHADNCDCECMHYNVTGYARWRTNRDYHSLLHRFRSSTVHLVFMGLVGPTTAEPSHTICDGRSAWRHGAECISVCTYGRAPSTA